MTMLIARSRALAIAVAMAAGCAVLVPLVNAQGGTRIAGKVVSSTTGAPLDRVRVTIADVMDRTKTATVVTGEGGTFVLANLPAGKYSLTAARRGFIESGYMQHANFSTAIATGSDADSEHLVFRLTPQAILSGRVFDEAGDPVRKARVSLYRQEQMTGIGQVRRVSGAVTDDRGSYEFAELAAGDYFLSVTARPWYAVNPRSMQTGGGSYSKINSDGSQTMVTQEPTVVTPEAIPGFDVTYATTFYPDATDSDEATPIPLRGGERLTVDMHLNPVAALRIVLRMQDPEHGGFAMPQITTKVFDSTDNLMARFMDRRPNGEDDFQGRMINPIGRGVIELTGIPAGKYSLRMPGNPGTGSTGTHSEVDLTQDGQEVTPAAGESAGSAKFAVHVMGDAGMPQGLMLALRAADRKVTRAGPVDADGKCEIQEVPPGKYDLLAATPNTDYAVTRMVVNGSPSRGHALEVAAGSSIDATVVLVSGQVVVQGTAKREGKAVAGAMIVLVPKDPESHGELFRRDQSDSDGTFSLANIIPGEYTIVAIDDGWDLHWSEPGVIEHYVPNGQKVVVPAGEHGTMRLAEAVEVQQK
jgi:uncharacterized protein (DUF2141 family)